MNCAEARDYVYINPTLSRPDGSVDSVPSLLLPAEDVWGSVLEQEADRDFYKFRYISYAPRTTRQHLPFCDWIYFARSFLRELKV